MLTILGVWEGGSERNWDAVRVLNEIGRNIHRHVTVAISCKVILFHSVIIQGRVAILNRLKLRIKLLRIIKACRI